MCRELAPDLSVDGAAAAVEAEEAESRTGYIRRRSPPVADGLDCCVGLKGVPGDDLDLTDSNFKDKDSSRSKADATPVEAVEGPPGGESPSGPEKLEHGSKPADLADPDGIRPRESHGEALKRGETTCGPLPRGNPTGILEHGPCRHPLAALLVTRMDLDVVVQVDCAAGCGHRVYSDRGPVECPVPLAGGGGGPGCCCLEAWWRCSCCCGKVRGDAHHAEGSSRYVSQNIWSLSQDRKSGFSVYALNSSVLVLTIDVINRRSAASCSILAFCGSELRRAFW